MKENKKLDASNLLHLEIADNDIDLVTDYELNSNISNLLINNTFSLKTEISNLLYNTPAFIKAVKDSIPKSSSDYKLVFSRLQKAKLKAGSLELLTKKDGTLIAKLIDPKSKQFVSGVSLKKVSLSPQLLKSITSYTTQLQMVHISEQIHHIQLAIDDIRQGQVDDRFALAYSCEQKYLQACHLNDPGIKKTQLLQLISDAENSRNSLMIRQKRNLQFIENQSELFWKQVFSKTNTKKIDDRMTEIRESFNAINMVSIVEAVAYQELGEMTAAKQSLIHYSNHLNECYFKTDKFLERLDLLSLSSKKYWTIELVSIKEQLQKIAKSNEFFIEGETNDALERM